MRIGASLWRGRCFGLDRERASGVCGRGLPHLPVDAGIVRAVRILRSAGIPTYESCEGGEGHAFAEPTIKFGGVKAG